MEFSKTWIAFSREAGISSQCLSAGLNSLRKANYAQTGLYSNAFFNLSIGLERLLKLIYLIDFAIQNNGTFPSENDLRGKFHHDLEKLFSYARSVHLRMNGSKDRYEFSMISIQNDIVKFLSDFARASRYYNLDYLVGGKSLGKSSDPIARWFDEIGGPILEKHYTKRRQKRDSQFAAAMDDQLRGHVLVRYTAEDGTPLESFEDASLQTAKNRVLQKYGTFYCATVIRFPYVILSDLVHEAHTKRLADVPYLDEFFFPFLNDDAYLRSLKTFSPPGQ